MATDGLRIEDVAVEYRRKGLSVRAVDGVSLAVRPGEIVGLVGESGCGKSSVARAVVGLAPVVAGRVLTGDRAIEPLGRRRRPVAARHVQMIFQDPGKSLNPRLSVGRAVREALRHRERPLRGLAAAREVDALFERVGLGSVDQGRLPSQFSGGQQQRVCIARALASQPRVLVADEPVASLDASAQALVARLLADIVRERQIAMLFISHDLGIVRAIAHRTAVMYLGRLVETAETQALWSAPRHPYTRALIDAAIEVDGSGSLPVPLGGDVPDPTAPPPGCRFHPRCPQRLERCAVDVPRWAVLGEQRGVACWLHPPADDRQAPEPVHASESVGPCD